MKGTNTPGQALNPEGFTLLAPHGAGYLTLRSQHSLGRETIKMILSTRFVWE